MGAGRGALMAAAGRVLIVGGGPAGLSAGVVLGRRGVDAEIVEINDDLRPLGSGLTMTGATLRALRMVDEEALDRCIEQGAGHDALAFGNAEGDILHTVPMPPVAGPDKPGGFGIMRPLFWGLLAEAAQRAGARIRLSTTIEAIEQHADGVGVTFSDGSSGRFDLVVGSDGLHSKVRELVFPDAPEPFFTGQTVWRAVVPRPKGMSDDIGMYYGPRVKAGCNPTSSHEMYVFVVENTPEVTRPPREQWPEQIRALLSDFGGVIGWARERMTDAETIDRRPLHAILMPDPWHRGRVLLIGDAAHATTPHLASGAGIAIEDSVVLGELLDTHQSLDEALAAFMRRRYERCRLVVENSLQLGEWEKQPDDPQADPAALSNASFAALAAPF
jgi:2-polyprenyl-6-methoxyphenol hydroxylase-like FAD-dependent oxidoreductase